MAGIDNNTVLYLRGDSYNDLSLYNNSNLINKGTSTISDGWVDINDTYMMINYNSIIAFSSATTIDFDIIFKKSISSSSAIISKGHIHSQSIPDYELGLGSNTITIDVGTGSGITDKDSSYFSYTFVLYKKYHIALVFDGGYKYSIYINGSLVGVHTSKYKPTSTKNLYIGDRQSLDYSSNFLISNFRISNIARYSSNFTPPTKPYNSIDINITNQTEDKIGFNVSKLGQEVINKIEVLVNNGLSKTYDTIGDLTYNIDKSLLSNGNNKIKIKVTFDNDYTEEKEIDYEYVINNLPASSSLKELIDRQEQLDNVISVQRDMLRDILINKNLEVSDDENKLSILIDKVNDLAKYDDGKLWLYKDGNEYNDITGGWVAGGQNGTIGKIVITKNSSNIVVKNNSTASAYWYGGISTKNPISLNLFSKLYADLTVDAHSQVEAILQVCDNVNADNGLSGIVVNIPKGRQIISVNVSNDNSARYIRVAIDKQYQITVNRIWLEK